MRAALVTVVETRSFAAAAKGRMTRREVEALIELLAAEPESGALIRGTGGIRKVRFATGGMGKRGGLRVVYYFHNEAMPLFLLTVFAKNELARALRESYGE